MATDDQTGGQQEQASTEPASFRLRVANLAWGTEDDSFKKYFADYNPTEAVIIRRKKNKRSRGYGFVTFSSETDRDGALEKLNGSELDGREIAIAVSTSKGPYPEGSKKPAPAEAQGGDDDAAPVEQSAARLIVQRLNWKITNQSLREAFEKYGPCKAVVIRNRKNKRSRGYGFVTFDKEEDGQKALEELNGNEELGFKQEGGDGNEGSPVGIKVIEATSTGPRPKPKRTRKPRGQKKDDGDNKSQDKTAKPGPRRLFVKAAEGDEGFKGASEEQIREAFEKFGEVTQVKQLMEGDEGSQTFRGIAFVTFKEHTAFTEAKDAFAEGGNVGGGAVVVKRALPSRNSRYGGNRGSRRNRRRTAGGGASATDL